ncbi:MAG: NUDIX domain-containing protein [Candidatus Tagabacteria bacterium]
MTKSKIIPITERHATQPFVVVGCLIEKDGKFLFIYQGGKYNQPVGWLELREDILSGAKRETEEETGIEVEITDFLGTYTLIKQKGDKILHAVKFMFIAKPTGNKSDSKEVLESKWLSIEEIKKMDGQFWDPDVIKEIEDFESGKRYPLSIFNNFTDLSTS